MGRDERLKYRASEAALCMGRPTSVSMKTWYEERQKKVVGYSMSFSGLKRDVGTLRKGLELKSRGRQPSLSPDELRTVHARLDSCSANIMSPTRSIIKLEVERVVASRYISRATSEAELTRMYAEDMKRAGGKGHVRSIRNAAGMTESSSKRPMEKERAMTCQPELVLEHGRNIYWLYALMQIHRRIGEGVRVEGWEIRDRLVTREGSDDAPGPDLLETEVMDDGAVVVIVKPLKEPLEAPEPRMMVCCDEKPLLPHSPVLKTMATAELPSFPAMAASRSANWSCMLWAKPDGTLLPMNLILRGDSIGEGIVRAAAAHFQTNGARLKQKDFGITATKKAVQSPDTLAADVERVLPLLGATWDNPNIIFLDGHFSHISRTVLRKAREHYCYMLVEPK